MKTITDLEKMKTQEYRPFSNAYDGLMATLEDYYIAKSNGVERIKAALNDWDRESQIQIVNHLIIRISQSGMMDFDAGELLALVR